MKKLFHILLIPLVIFTYSHQVLLSQITTQKKSKTYFTWVKLMDKKSYAKKGYLKEIEDSLIGFYTIAKNEIMYFKVEDIKTLEFRKEGSVSKGFLYGALTGFAIGAIIGPLGEDDSFPTPLLAMAGGIALVVPGSLIGGLIRSMKIKIPINGNQNKYNAKKEKLEKYKYKY